MMFTESKQKKEEKENENNPSAHQSNDAKYY